MKKQYFNIAGTTFAHFDEISHTIKIGDEVKAIPEPTNPYDNKAIALYYKGLKIGYVPKGQLVLNNEYTMKVHSLNLFEGQAVGAYIETDVA